MALTIEDLVEEFDRGSITEADLRDPLMHLDGFCDFASNRVYVNPKPAVVETLLHELIHRRHKRWSEARVDREAKRLLCQMTHADVARWYRKYQAVARKRQRPMKIED